MKHSSCYVCDNCGADIVFCENEYVKICSYCGVICAIVNDSIYDKNITNIIPFEVSFEDALRSAIRSGQFFSRYNSDDYKVDKVFIPFCDIECDVMGFANCCVQIDDQKFYYDAIVDGKINNYMHLLTEISANDRLIFDDSINKSKSVKYDPLIANNCEIFSIDVKYINKKIDNVAKEFCQDAIRFFSTASISNFVSSEYNINIKNTLVPFYRVTFSDNQCIYILGQYVTNTVSNSLERTRKIWVSIMLLCVILAFVVMHFDGYVSYEYGVIDLSWLLNLILLSMAIVTVLLFGLPVLKKRRKHKYGTYKVIKNRKIKLLGKYIDIFKKF